MSARKFGNQRNKLALGLALPRQRRGRRHRAPSALRGNPDALLRLIAAACGGPPEDGELQSLPDLMMPERLPSQYGNEKAARATHRSEDRADLAQVLFCLEELAGVESDLGSYAECSSAKSTRAKVFGKAERLLGKVLGRFGRSPDRVQCCDAKHRSCEALRQVRQVKMSS